MPTVSPITRLKEYYRSLGVKRLLFPHALAACLSDTQASDLDILDTAFLCRRNATFLSLLPELNNFFSSPLFVSWSKMKVFPPSIQRILNELTVPLIEHPQFPMITKIIRKLWHNELLTQDIWAILDELIEQHPTQLEYFDDLLYQMAELELLSPEQAQDNLKAITSNLSNLNQYSAFIRVLVKTRIISGDQRQEIFGRILDMIKPNPNNSPDELQNVMALTDRLEEITDILCSETENQDAPSIKSVKYKRAQQDFISVLFKTLLETEQLTNNSHAYAMAFGRYDDFNHVFNIFFELKPLEDLSLLKKVMPSICKKYRKPFDRASLLSQCLRFDTSSPAQGLELFNMICDSLPIRAAYFWLHRLRQSQFSLTQAQKILWQLALYPTLLAIDWSLFTRLPILKKSEIDHLLFLGHLYQNDPEALETHTNIYLEKLSQQEQRHALQQSNQKKTNVHHNSLIPSVESSCLMSIQRLFAEYKPKLIYGRRYFLLKNLSQHLDNHPIQIHKGLKRIASMTLKLIIKKSIDYKYPGTNFSLQDFLAIIWLAMQDKTKCHHPIEDSLARLIRALSDIFDERSTRLELVCPKGMFHKLLEALWGSHDDVHIVVMSYHTLGWKLNALVKTTVQNYLKQKDARIMLSFCHPGQSFVSHLATHSRNHCRRTV